MLETTKKAARQEDKRCKICDLSTSTERQCVSITNEDLLLKRREVSNIHDEFAAVVNYFFWSTYTGTFQPLNFARQDGWG
jgi:hypothetical protein